MTGDSLETQVVPETVSNKNALEGSMLIHGLTGDNTLATGTSEIDTLKGILAKGYIVSPSKRHLTEKEKKRYQKYNPMDLNRVCFDALSGEPDDVYTNHYYKNVMFVIPVEALADTVIAEDPYDRRGGKTISAYSPNGVEIPIKGGLLIIDDPWLEKNRDNELSELLAQAKWNGGLGIAQVYPGFLHNKENVFENGLTEVGVARGVKYRPVTKEEQNQFLVKNRYNGKILDEFLITKPISRREQLGTIEKKPFF